MDFQDNNNNQELMEIFRTESEEIVERIFEGLSNLEKAPQNPELSADLYRNMHSLKGALRMVGYNNLQNIIHHIEDIFDIVKTNNVILDNKNFFIITKL